MILFSIQNPKSKNELTSMLYLISRKFFKAFTCKFDSSHSVYKLHFGYYLEPCDHYLPWAWGWRGRRYSDSNKIQNLLKISNNIFHYLQWESFMPSVLLFRQNSTWWRNRDIFWFYKCKTESNIAPVFCIAKPITNSPSSLVLYWKQGKCSFFQLGILSNISFYFFIL